MSTEQQEKPTGLALLRAPFPANLISKKPQPTKGKDEVAKLPKASCSVCGGWHATSSIIHLDYVGHAALTDRLLDADPNWTWEPMAVDADGLPKLDRNGGLWIKLTVCGVTRIGYGDADGKSGGGATKELIGDALRNAAMRFGAALDLWHKGDLHAHQNTDEGEQGQQRQPAGSQPAQRGEPRQDRATRAAQVAKRVEEGDATGAAEWLATLSQEDVDAIWKGLPAKVQTAISGAWPKSGQGQTSRNRNAQGAH